MPEIRDVLHAAVEAVGGQDRPGQIQMAEAVKHALDTGEHLLVQAGTGTGKSLGYLVPSLLHGKRVVVATATLNLQHQLVERDIPALKDAARATLDKVPHHAVVKGRGNYACLHRVREGAPDDQGTLVDVPEGSLGAEVVELREWAEEQAAGGHTGDRDSAPSHNERAWRQVSVNHRECLGASRCAHALECFAELAREDAHSAQVVVTNHALLAIDAIDGVPMLPEYDVVVVDEAHELAARVTQASTDELDPVIVERAARRARGARRGGRRRRPHRCLRRPRRRPGPHRGGTHRRPAAAAAGGAGACPRHRPRLPVGLPQGEGEGRARRRQAAGPRAWSTRSARSPSGWPPRARPRCLWLSDNRGNKQLHIAPIDVSGALRDKLFATRPWC